MSTAPNGRARRILNWLASHKKPLSLEQIHALECSYEAETTRQQVASTLAQLTDAGKAERTGTQRNYRYGATAKTLLDLRTKVAKQRGYTSTKARAPSPEQQPVVARKATACSATGSIVIGGTPSFRQSLTAEDLAADVAAFQRNGGHIQKLGPADVSKPFLHLFRDESPLPVAARTHVRVAKPDHHRDDELDDAA